MSKLYRITRNPENLQVNVDDPSGHYYKEYIDISDSDGENPCTEDFGPPKRLTRDWMDLRKSILKNLMCI